MFTLVERIVPADRREAGIVAARQHPLRRDDERTDPLYDSAMAIAKHLKISGRVQGVGFRHFISRNAQELHITGWVRNCHDGSVEAIIAGTAEAAHTMIERARHGPPHAMVEECRVSDAHGEFTRFETLPTA
jgi:acylphosphatase